MLMICQKESVGFCSDISNRLAGATKCNHCKGKWKVQRFVVEKIEIKATFLLATFSSKLTAATSIPLAHN